MLSRALFLKLLLWAFLYYAHCGHIKSKIPPQYTNKTELMIDKVKKLRKMFELDKEAHGKKKKKKSRKCKRKGKKRSCKKKKSKKIKKEGKKQRYYLENGKYKPHKLFEEWAKKYEAAMEEVAVDSSCSCGVSGPAGRTRIVNGEEAVAHSYPWVVAMMTRGGDYYCGGSIISDQWVLTAAHCVFGEPNNPARDMYVRVGDHDIPDEEEAPLADTFKVSFYIHHKKYDEDTTNNDIALLKLEKTIKFSDYAGTVAPVCLPDRPRKYYGEEVTVAGWGLLSDGGRAATTLQEVNLEILWMNQCREDFKYQKSWITSRMMCTYRPEQDACQGDSGGPLVRLNTQSGRYEQVGVVSWGIGCASHKYPGVFVKLSHYLNWLVRKTGKSTYCTG